MKDDTINDEVGHSSFAIALEPQFKEGKWTGEVTAHIEEQISDDLDSDEIMQIRSVCGMVACTLQMMEQDPDFLEDVKAYFADSFIDILDGLEDDSQKPPSQLFTRSEDGKVITLNFATKTHGSA